MVDATESHQWPFIKRGRFVSRVYQLQIEQIIHYIVCHVIDGRCACHFLTRYPVWDTCLISELGKTECQIIFKNIVCYCHVHPIHSLWLAWIEAYVYSGNDRWQGDKCYIEGVSAVQTCSTASKPSELCGLWCSDWHSGSYSHVSQFSAKHLAYIWAAVKDCVPEKNTNEIQCLKVAIYKIFLIQSC